MLHYAALRVNVAKLVKRRFYFIRQGDIQDIVGELRQPVPRSESA